MFNQKRLKFTFVVFFILLAFILFDIFQLQTTEFESTSDIIDQQNLDKFYITAPRGEIFDANGEKIAETKLEPHLFINMRKITCLLYTSPSPRDLLKSRMPSSA